MSVTISTCEEDPFCPLDGQRMREWMYVAIDADRGIPNPYGALYRCPCGHGIVHPSPTPEEVASFYRLDDYYTHQSIDFAPPSSFLDRLRTHFAWKADRTIPRIEWLLKSLPKGSVCDIGCGAGKDALELKKAGYEVVGVEPDPDAASRTGKAFEVHEGTAESLPDALQGRKFDAVVMSQVLEHCIRPEKALANVRGLLRDGGVFACEVPNNEALGLQLSGGAWAMLDVPRHLHFFTARSLASYCEKAGFRLLSVGFAEYLRQISEDFLSRESRWHQALYGRSVNSSARAWGFLALTALAPARYKYDSVRVVASPA